MPGLRPFCVGLGLFITSRTHRAHAFHDEELEPNSTCLKAHVPRDPPRGSRVSLTPAFVGLMLAVRTTLVPFAFTAMRPNAERLRSGAAKPLAFTIATLVVKQLDPSLSTHGNAILGGLALQSFIWPRRWLGGRLFVPSCTHHANHNIRKHFQSNANDTRRTPLVMDAGDFKVETPLAGSFLDLFLLVGLPRRSLLVRGRPSSIPSTRCAVDHAKLLAPRPCQGARPWSMGNLHALAVLFSCTENSTCHGVGNPTCSHLDPSTGCAPKTGLQAKYGICRRTAHARSVEEAPIELLHSRFGLRLVPEAHEGEVPGAAIFRFPRLKGSRIHTALKQPKQRLIEPKVCNLQSVTSPTAAKCSFSRPSDACFGKFFTITRDIVGVTPPSHVAGAWVVNQKAKIVEAGGAPQLSKPLCTPAHACSHALAFHAGGLLSRKLLDDLG